MAVRKFHIGLVFSTLCCASVRLSAQEPHFYLEGDRPNDGFGRTVAAFGDLDGDGVDEFGASAGSAGYARVYSGADASVLYDFTSLGTYREISNAGDVNGDGLDDILLRGQDTAVHSARMEFSCMSSPSPPASSSPSET